MIKNYIKFVFAFTIGISLFQWNPVNSNVDAKYINDTNISMDTTESHSFNGNEPISLVSNSIFKLSGRTITPINIGQEIVTVGDVDYLFDVSLPITYHQLEYAKFNIGTVIDTGVIFDSNDIEFSFTYCGTLTDYSFGCDDLHDKQTLTVWNNHLCLGNPNQVACGGGFRYAEEPKKVSLSIQNNAIKCQVGDNNYSNTLLGSIVSGYSFRFGQIQRLFDDKLTSFVGDLYDLSLSNNGILLRNYYPVFNTSTKTVGFYDTVNNTFISSIGNAPLISDTIEVGYKISDTSIQYATDGKLIFDSNADFSNMNGKLMVADGIKLSGSIAGKTLIVGEDNLDLTTIFGEMNPDTPYTLSLTNDVVTETVKFIKRTSSIPTLSINGEKPLAYLEISKNNECPGTMSFDDGIEVISSNLKKIKGRGNSFGPNRKNSFNITFPKKISLIPGVSAKKYCLIGNGYRGHDFFINQVGYTLYQQICTNGDAVAYNMIDFKYNGIDQGLYMLTEKIEINSGSVNITQTEMEEGTNVRTVNKNTSNITPQEQEVLSSGIKEFRYCPTSIVSKYGGIIIEAGYYYGSSSSGFITSHNQKWEIKEPEYLTLTQISRISSYVQNAEDALFSNSGRNSKGEHYTEFYDLDSIAREFLVRSFTTDNDFYASSNYLYIDGNDQGLIGKLYAGPVWDLDYTYMQSSALYNSVADRNNCAGGFRESLMDRGDFVKTLYEINRDYFNPLVTDIVNENNHDSPTIYDFYSEYYSSRVSDDLLWKHSVVSSSNQQKGYTISRANKWQNFWSDKTNALRGVTIKKDISGDLIAEAVGASSYQWYKVDSSGEDIKITNATLSTYKPEESGTYYVSVTGTSLAGINHTVMTSNSIDTASTTFEFDMQNHGEQISSQKVIIGTLAMKPQNPYESGYLFAGWYKEAECLNYWNFDTDVVNEETTVYAKWIEGGTRFKGTSISLYDYTWINMYTDLTDKDYLDYTFTYQIRNEEEVDVETEMVKKIDGKWRISVTLLPYQLADVITIRMYDAEDRLICAKADSVRAYGKRLLDNSKSQTEKDAMQALLNYGAAAQILKEYHIDDLANDFSKLPA